MQSSLDKTPIAQRAAVFQEESSSLVSSNLEPPGKPKTKNRGAKRYPHDLSNSQNMKITEATGGEPSAMNDPVGVRVSPPSDIEAMEVDRSGALLGAAAGAREPEGFQEVVAKVKS